MISLGTLFSVFSASLVIAALVGCSSTISQSSNQSLSGEPCTGKGGVLEPYLAREMRLPGNAAFIGIDAGDDHHTKRIPIGPFTLSAIASQGDLCVLRGKIFSATSPRSENHIEFSIVLPRDLAQWNGKAVQIGGGGFDGALPPLSISIAFLNGASATLPDRGYMVFGSDGGHQGARNTRFMLDEEARRNYAGNQLKRVHDVALFLARQFYGLDSQSISTYFWGSSNGGREAITAIQHWPQDYRGAVAFFPAVNFVPLLMYVGELSRRLGHGGALSAKQARRLSALLDDTCAGDDGTRTLLGGTGDGLITDPESCRKQMPRILDQLQAAPEKFTAEQIATIRAFITTPVLPIKLKTEPGEYYVFAGANPFLKFGAIDSLAWGIPAAAARLFGSAPAPDDHGNDGAFSGTYFWREASRNLLTTDSDYHAIAGAPQEQPNNTDLSVFYRQNRAHIDEVLEEFRNDPEQLEPFFKQGGKLILVHGMADDLIGTQGTVNYYNQLIRNLSTYRDDVRLFLVPGFGHGTGAFIPVWDSVGELDRWVRTGVLPQPTVGRASIGDVLFQAWLNRAPRDPSRWPLCSYPALMRAARIQRQLSYTCTDAHSTTN